MAPGQGVLGSNLRNTQEYMKKNLLFQNHLAQMQEIWYVALSSGLYQVCSNEGPRVQDGPVSGVLGLKLGNA